MTASDPKIVPIKELRFKPANSNDRARAGLVHDFQDVPACSFAKDDGISPYMASDATIGEHPHNPALQAVIHENIPDVQKDAGAPALFSRHRLLRTGFALSVFVHAAAAFAVGYATLAMPADDALLEGETIIAVEFYSDTDSDVTTRTRQVEQEGEDEVADEPVEQPKVEIPEPVREIAKPVEQPKPVEEPEVKEPAPVVKAPDEVLSTQQPSAWQVEAAARQILDETKIEPLPELPSQLLPQPVEEKKPEPKPEPVEQKVVEKPEPKPVEEKPEPRKEEPKKPEPKKAEPEKKPEPKKEKPRRKKTAARDGNAESDSNKGSSQSTRKNGQSQDASQGNSKRSVKGNASMSNYKGLVQRKLERARKRVSAPGKGRVVVSFVITANGGVTNLRVRTSSGKAAVDARALDVVRKATPFPAIPADAGKKTYPVSVPMTFKGN